MPLHQLLLILMFTPNRHAALITFEKEEVLTINIILEKAVDVFNVNFKNRRCPLIQNIKSLLLFSFVFVK